MHTQMMVVKLVIAGAVLIRAIGEMLLILREQ